MHKYDIVINMMIIENVIWIQSPHFWGGIFSQLSSFDQPFRKYNIDTSQIKYW